jgi:DNA-binding transcriptional regulator YhcF (GntR family)
MEVALKTYKYISIGNRVIDYIKENNLMFGNRLLSYREFAALFGTNRHTIASALERLQHKGIVYSTGSVSNFV